MYITICKIDHQSRLDTWNRALNRCTRTTQRNGMVRDVRGVLGWQTHVHPWLIHVNVWQNPPQYCKVINLQLTLKINFYNAQEVDDCCMTFHMWCWTSKGKFKGKQFLQPIYSDFRRQMGKTGGWWKLVQYRPYLNSMNIPPLIKRPLPIQRGK